METTESLLKSIITAESHYSVHKIERNLLDLQRQIDVLISKTSRGCSLKFFNPSDVLAAECIACLVNLVSDPATKPSLLLKCILFFNNLVTDNQIRECLHEKFNLTPSLVGVIVNHGASTSDTLTAEAMQLLQKVTYGHRISFQESYMDELVRFLTKNIVSPATGLTQPALGIMVNLTRDNFSVQSFIKNNEDMKEFTRTLTQLLGDQNLNVLVFSLTLLLNVCQSVKMAAKFYNEKNASPTFQMVFNVLIDGKPSDTRRYAVDLFKDILKVERLRKCFASYEYLGTCIEQTLGLLNTSSHESVVKIFEFLQVLCRVEGVRRVVCKAMFATFHIQDASQFAGLAQTPLSRIADPLLATIHWAGQSTDNLGLAPLGAFDLLIELYEEQILSHNKMHYDKHVAAILPMALHTLQVPLEGDNPTITKRCSVMVKCVKLLLIFCQDDSLLTLISKQIDPKLLTKLLYFQFDHNSTAMLREVSPPTDDWSNIGVDLVLNLLELIARIKNKVLEDFFITTMQEEKIIPFLACGLCSTNRERVTETLHLIQMCSKLEGFQTCILGDVLAYQNAAKERRHEAMIKVPFGGYPNKRMHLEDKENILVTRRRDNASDNTDADINESVHTLTEKVNSGLGIKDVQQSEIVASYERSLQALQTKEQHLQDLLEAKTLSLTQADRMLAQYRSRKGQDEAECYKLRALLIEAEKKCKSLDGESSDMRNRIERCTKEIEDLHTENQKLQQVAQMHQQLTVAHTELTEKYESVQKAHQTLRQEHKSLTEMHEMLQKHNTNLKQQFDNTMEQLTTLQEERRKVMSQLKSAETKLDDTKKAALKWEYEYKRSEEEREVMEASIETLRDKMGKSEEKKKDLQDQVAKLEFACNQNEQKISSYEAEINGLQSEVAKHRQITALINSLSSGNASDTSGLTNK